MKQTYRRPLIVDLVTNRGFSAPVFLQQGLYKAGNALIIESDTACIITQYTKQPKYPERLWHRPNHQFHGHWGGGGHFPGDKASGACG